VRPMPFIIGGDKRDRTADLLNAIQADFIKNLVIQPFLETHVVTP
jgi:hypothetical protein